MINKRLLPMTLLALLLFSGCGNDENTPEVLAVTGALLSRTDCMSGTRSGQGDILLPANNESRVDYAFDSTNHRLVLKHYNAGFNCCFDSIYCRISCSGDTVSIQENEANPKCNCDCLYDLIVEVNGISDKQYVISFIEPYCGDQEKLIFSIDLAKNKEGSYTVPRLLYPWNLPI